MATTEVALVYGARSAVDWCARRLPGALAALGLTWSAAMFESGAQQPASPGQEVPDAAELIERLRQIQQNLGATGGVPQVAPMESASRAQLSADQISQRLAADLGVHVLSVEPVAHDERPVYAAKVMNPPGNYNAAFMVTTLLVDGDSGEILGQAAATPDPESPDVLPEARRPSSDGSGLEIRRRTYR